MARLLVNTREVQRATGFILREGMLTPKLCLDGKSLLPLLLERDGRDQYLVTRDWERGNLSWPGMCRIPVLYYQPYMIPGRTDRPFAGLVELLQEKTKGENLWLDPELPIKTYRKIRQAMKVEVLEWERFHPFRLYRAHKNVCSKHFYQNRKRITDLARKFACERSEPSSVLDFLDENQQDERLQKLEKLMSDSRIGSIILSSPVNFQEVSGLSIDFVKNQDVLAMFKANDPFVYILTPAEIDAPHFQDVRSFPNRRAAIDEICEKGEIGLEEDDLDIGRYFDLGGDGFGFKEGSQLLRTWRQGNIGQDVAYFLVAAQASSFAITGALDLVRRRINDHVPTSEMDIYRHYLSLVREFSESNGITGSLRLRPYFTNCQSGARSIVSAIPRDYQIGPHINAFKLDAGLQLIDGPGLVHASSNIGRMHILTAEGKEVYDICRESALAGILPAAKPGIKASEVYWSGVGEFEKRADRLRRVGMIPETYDVKRDFLRPIGHLLERQETFVFGFDRDCEEYLSAGMIACAEFQWPYKEHSIVFEETFLVTSKGGVPISF